MIGRLLFVVGILIADQGVRLMPEGDKKVIRDEFLRHYERKDSDEWQATIKRINARRAQREAGQQ